MNEINEYLLNIPRFTTKPTMEHTKELLERLDVPKSFQKIIHVAGTNGKGSVCNYMTRMLLASGKTVGTFTSPHLVDIRERIAIQGEMVEEEVFARAFHRVMNGIGALEHPSFFEFLFLMAMVVFAEKEVEYVILETGLGGRLDATNAIENPAVSVITSLSFDHTEILGDTIEKIAAEKAGIIKKGAPVFFDGSNDKKAIRVLEEKANEVGTEAICVQAVDFALSIPGEYQKQNAALAWEAFLYLAKTEGWHTEGKEKNARSTLLATRWKGRMDEILPGVYIDGAHNEDAMKKFAAAVKDIPCKGRRLLLFSGVREKNLEKISRILIDSGLFDKLILTELNSYRSAKLSELQELFVDFDAKSVICEKNLEKAYSHALQEKKEDDTLFCTGSLYLVGSILEILSKEETHD